MARETRLPYRGIPPEWGSAAPVRYQGLLLSGQNPEIARWALRLIAKVLLESFTLCAGGTAATSVAAFANQTRVSGKAQAPKFVGFLWTRLGVSPFAGILRLEGKAIVLRTGLTRLAALALLPSLAALHAQQTIINTVAGKGRILTGVPGPATGVPLAEPWGMAFDSKGNLYVADVQQNVVF